MYTMRKDNNEKRAENKTNNDWRLISSAYRNTRSSFTEKKQNSTSTRTVTCTTTNARTCTLQIHIFKPFFISVDCIPILSAVTAIFPGWSNGYKHDAVWLYSLTVMTPLLGETSTWPLPQPMNLVATVSPVDYDAKKEIMTRSTEI